MNYLGGLVSFTQTVTNIIDIGYSIRNVTGKFTSNNTSPTITTPAKDKPELLDQHSAMIKLGITLLVEKSILKIGDNDETATKLIVGDHMISVLFPTWNQSLKHYKVSVENLESLHITVQNTVDQKGLNPKDETDRLYLIVGMEGLKALATAYENKYNIRLKKGYKKEDIYHYNEASEKLKTSATKIEDYLKKCGQKTDLEQFLEKLQVVNNIVEENLNQKVEEKIEKKIDEKVEQNIEEKNSMQVIFHVPGLFKNSNHALNPTCPLHPIRSLKEQLRWKER